MRYLAENVEDFNSDAFRRFVDYFETFWVNQTLNLGIQTVRMG